MQDIKFRAFDVDNQKMIYVDVSNAKSLNDLLPLYEYSTCDLMQYTGFKDTNGKEIYEGDIIKVNIDIKVIDKSAEHIAIVDFVDGSFVLKNKSKSRGDIKEITLYDFIHEANDLDISFEIIGNRYENPEMLKKW